MKIPRSTRAETTALIGRAQGGDERALEQLLAENLPLVVKAAKHWSGFSVPVEDLIQFGRLGLWHAIRKMDLAQGCALSTYSWHWIRQYITRGFHSMEHAVALPAHALDASARIHRARMHLATEGNDTPTCRELAEAARLTVRAVECFEDLPAVVRSLDAALDEEMDSPLERLTEDDDAWEALERGLLSEEMNERLAVLSRREREVIEMRFGLFGRPAMSLREVGAQLGVSGQCVSLDEKRALRALKETWEEGNDGND